LPRLKHAPGPPYPRMYVLHWTQFRREKGKHWAIH
jgi:hypothetical protein